MGKRELNRNGEILNITSLCEISNIEAYPHMLSKRLLPCVISKHELVVKKVPRGYHPWMIAQPSNKAKRTSLSEGSAFKGAEIVEKDKQKEN